MDTRAAFSGGDTAMTQVKFNGFIAGDEQLAARQIGLIFPYMNTDTVWQSFCDSYNGMLDLLTQFVTWYTQQGGAASDLAGEWPRFIRSELDMVVNAARNNLKVMDQSLKSSGVLYLTRWRTVMNRNGGEIQKVKLERTDRRRNLPASTVGPFTG
jgi:chitinase